VSTTAVNGKLDQALGTQTTALSLRVLRQQALATNIANADTPGYKAIDIDFASAMRAATGSATGAEPAPRVLRAAATPAVTASGHQPGNRSAFAGLSTASFRMMYRMPAQASADGNSVDMDLERARFAENSVKYEAALKFLNGQIKTLMSAIQG